MPTPADRATSRMVLRRGTVSRPGSASCRFRIFPRPWFRRKCNTALDDNGHSEPCPPRSRQLVIYSHTHTASSNPYVSRHAKERCNRFDSRICDLTGSFLTVKVWNQFHEIGRPPYVQTRESLGSSGGVDHGQLSWQVFLGVNSGEPISNAETVGIACRTRLVCAIAAWHRNNARDDRFRVLSGSARSSGECDFAGNGDRLKWRRRGGRENHHR